MTPIVTQVLVKKNQSQAMARPVPRKGNVENERQLYRNDVAGFLIFVVIVFTVLMISLYA